jgi:hypothetical protein
MQHYSDIDTWFVLAAKGGTATSGRDTENPGLLSAAAPLFDGVIEKEGAVNGLNTFFYLTGLGQHPNIRLVDGDDTKAGRYLPACEQAVALPAAEVYAEAGVIYVSAATFFDEIRQDLVTRFGVPAEKIRSLFQAPETRSDS